jgi:prolyl oligopeptidase
MVRRGKLLVLVLAVSLAGCAAGVTRNTRRTGGERPDARLPAGPPDAGARGGGARAFPYPEASRRPVVDTFFGTAVPDDYRWLEDGASAEVRAWASAENALTRGHLDGLAERAMAKEKLAAILGGASPDWTSLRHVAKAGLLFALKSQPPKQQEMVVVFDAGVVAGSTPASAGKEGKEPRSPEIALAEERVIVDPNVLDATGKTAVDFFVPSPDGKLVAVSLSKDGTESGDVHVFEVASGKARGDVIARVHGGTAGGSVAWRADGKGFWYTRYPRVGERPEADLGFYQEVWFHTLGDDPAKDVYAFGRGLPKIAEIALEASDDGRVVLAEVSNGDGGEVEHHALAQDVAKTPSWTRLSRFEDEAAHAVFGPDGKIYAVSRKGAPRGKVIAFAPPFTAAPEQALAESDAVIEDLVVAKDALYVIDLLGGPSRVRRIPLAPKAEPLAQAALPRGGGKKANTRGGAASPTRSAPAPASVDIASRGVPFAELPLPPVASVSGVVRVFGDLLFRVETFTTPPAWYRYRASEHRLVKTPLARNSPVDFADVSVTREACTSKDGTRVPMTLLRRKDAPKDGARPTFVTGYGGFGVSRKPRMRGWYRLWLDAGGVVAETNLRGGAELGEAWHKAGMLTHKQNVFDDFAACLQAVVDLGWTRPDKIAVYGRSNGGLLIGATLTQHPGMFRAAVAEVGIHDMLRTELSSNGAFNVTEYGSVKDEAQLRALLGYSPLHAVKDGVAYPAVLLLTGENDPRVDPYQSRKMTARLQAATRGDRPVLLRTTPGTGHGMGTPLAQEIEETADWIAFLMHEVGASPSR